VASANNKRPKLQGLAQHDAVEESHCCPQAVAEVLRLQYLHIKHRRSSFKFHQYISDKKTLPLVMKFHTTSGIQESVHHKHTFFGKGTNVVVPLLKFARRSERKRVEMQLYAFVTSTVDNDD